MTGLKKFYDPFVPRLRTTALWTGAAAWWTYDNTWYWGSGSGTVDGHRFGFNIGYGFGDTSAASENILFYDGVGHKLDDVTFLISDNYTDPLEVHFLGRSV